MNREIVTHIDTHTHTHRNGHTHTHTQKEIEGDTQEEREIGRYSGRERELEIERKREKHTKRWWSRCHSYHVQVGLLLQLCDWGIAELGFLCVSIHLSI